MSVKMETPRKIHTHSSQQKAHAKVEYKLMNLLVLPEVVFIIEWCTYYQTIGHRQNHNSINLFD